MNTFNDNLDNLPKSFEEFWSKITADLNLSSEADTELLQIEVERLFSTALFEAMAEVLSEEEKLAIEEYLLLHRDENPLEHYFAMAAHKDNVKAVLHRVLQETLEQVEYLKSKIR